MTTKKIGKGTGKNAAKHKREAQQLMAKCQTAVPAWIMPINKALESLDPSKNKFDIIIIDEASQSDISALAIFYIYGRYGGGGGSLGGKISCERRLPYCPAVGCWFLSH